MQAHTDNVNFEWTPERHTIYQEIVDRHGGPYNVTAGMVLDEMGPAIVKAHGFKDKVGRLARALGVEQARARYASATRSETVEKDPGEGEGRGGDTEGAPRRTAGRRRGGGGAEAAARAPGTPRRASAAPGLAPARRGRSGASRRRRAVGRAPRPKTRTPPAPPPAPGAPAVEAARQPGRGRGTALRARAAALRNRDAARRRVPARLAVKAEERRLRALAARGLAAKTPRPSKHWRRRRRG